MLRALRSEGAVITLDLDDIGIVTDIDTLDDLRHAEALYKARRGPARLPGVALAALGLVPVANLLVPVLGIAAMVHVLQGSGFGPELRLSRPSGP